MRAGWYGLAGAAFSVLFMSAAPVAAQQGGDNVLEAAAACDATTIAIGALPRVACHVTITKWRTDTTDPVELKLTKTLDAAGNLRNGLQVSGAGTIDPSGLALPYRWDLSVFACPGTDTGGAACGTRPVYPEKNFIELELSQAGAKPLKFMTWLTATGPAYAGPGLAGRELRIGSASNAARFLRLGMDKKRVELDYITTTYSLAIWEIEAVEGTTYVRLRNSKERDRYLHMAKETLEIGYADPNAETTHWEVLHRPQTYFYTLTNRARPGSYLRVDAGKATAGPADPSTLDAQWWVLQ